VPVMMTTINTKHLQLLCFGCSVCVCRTSAAMRQGLPAAAAAALAAAAAAA